MDLKDPFTLLGAWLLVPALVTLTATGLGLGLGVVSGLKLRALTLPAGFLAGIAIVTLALEVGIDGAAATVLCAACALAGGLAYAVRHRPTARRPPAPTVWAAGCAAAAYAIGMAPLAGSGRSGIVGYVLNNDPATHISLVEVLRETGAVMTGEKLDSFHNATQVFAEGYPLGTYAWPVFASVAGDIEAFHLWMPMIALTVAMTALVAFHFLRLVAASPPFAAVAGIAAATAYLPFSYLAQGGAKELIMPLAVYATVGLALLALEHELTWRSLVPAAFGTAAAIGNLGYAALAWLGPAGLVVLAILVGRALRRRSLADLRCVLPYAGLSLALSLPAVIESVKFLDIAKGDYADPNEVGNLLGPLPWTEAFGIWLAGDYRFETPEWELLTTAGIALAAGFALGGLLYALVRRVVGIPLAVGTGVAGALLIYPRVSIYYDAKTLVVLAPALAMATAAGVLWLSRSGRPGRVLATGAGATLLLGLAASDAFVYSSAWITPNHRFSELADIGERFSGQGPMLVVDREYYSLYLLRKARPWDDWGDRQPHRGLKAPVPPGLPHTPDFDDYTHEHLARFPLLLERRRPGGSLPPEGYRHELDTRHYRVWRRVGRPGRRHLGLGVGSLSGSEPLRCRSRAVRRLVREARAGGSPLKIATGAPEPTLVVPPWAWVGFVPARVRPPEGHLARHGGFGAFSPDLRRGRYEAYIQGSFGPGVRLFVGPRFVADAFGDLGLPSGWLHLGPLAVETGETFSLTPLERPPLLSGSRHFDITGPLVVVRQPVRRRVQTVEPARLSRFCGRQVDWIEIPA